MTRRDSIARRAFAAAAEGKQMAIAIEAFPANEPYTAAKKLSRILDGGDGGDLSPTWPVLDEILANDPDTVLRIISEALGFEPPRRRALDPEKVYAELVEQVGEMQRTLRWVGEEQKRQRQLAKVERDAGATTRKRA